MFLCKSILLSFRSDDVECVRHDLVFMALCENLSNLLNWITLTGGTERATTIGRKWNDNDDDVIAIQNVGMFTYTEN